MAGIIKRGNAYYATWKQDGKTIQRSTGIKVKSPGISPAQARQLARAQANEMENLARGRSVVSGAMDALRRMAFSTVPGSMPTVKEWLDSYAGTASAKTEQNRKRAFSVFMEYLGEKAGMRLDALTPVIMRDFIAWALERWARGTVSLFRQMLAAAFNRAVEDDILIKSPMPRINLVRESAAINPELGQDKTKRLPFTREEMQILINDFPAPWCDMVLVSFLTGGQRLGDICMLRWDCVDFQKGVISFSTHKTGHAVCLPMRPALVERLKRLRAEQGGKEPFVFPYMARRYGIQSGSISSEFTSLLKAWGITKGDAPAAPLKGKRRRVSEKSFHSIRHTFVTLARCEPTLTPDMVRGVVGHKSEEIERGYFTANAEQNNAVLGCMERIISPGA